MELDIFKDARFELFHCMPEIIPQDAKILDMVNSTDKNLDLTDKYDLIVYKEAHKNITNLEHFFSKINSALNKNGYLLFHYAFDNVDEINAIYHLETSRNIYLVSSTMKVEDGVNNYTAIYSNQEIKRKSLYWD
jgi:hypothetical protein